MAIVVSDDMDGTLLVSTLDLSRANTSIRGERTNPNVDWCCPRCGRGGDPRFHHCTVALSRPFAKTKL